MRGACWARIWGHLGQERALDRHGRAGRLSTGGEEWARPTTRDETPVIANAAVSAGNATDLLRHGWRNGMLPPLSEEPHRGSTPWAGGVMESTCGEPVAQETTSVANDLGRKWPGVSGMDYFAAMRAFVRAVQLGSFSRVAAEDGVKVSTVSRHIQALEEDIGAAVFNRSTRRLHLTEVGIHFHGDAVRILADLEEARSAATSMNASPRGLLRINIPTSFGRRHVAPHLGDFLAEHPEVRIEATLTDETVDLIASGSDLAVRIGTLADSALLAKRLAPHRRIVVASPDYLARRPPITSPGDLGRQECLAFALQPKDAWYFCQQEVSGEPIEVPVTGRLRMNDSDALLVAARAALGIALLPTWLAADDVATGRLAVILPEWTALIAPGPERAIWAVYPPKKIVPPKVKAFISFLIGRFGKPPYWDSPAAIGLSRAPGPQGLATRHPVGG